MWTLQIEGRDFDFFCDFSIFYDLPRWPRMEPSFVACLLWIQIVLLKLCTLVENLILLEKCRIVAAPERRITDLYIFVFIKFCYRFGQILIWIVKCICVTVRGVDC